MARRGFGDYVAAAFANRWNLLLLFGAAAAGVLSPRPDVLLPLVAAAEVLWLGLLSTNPRFHRAVDAEAAARERADGGRAAAGQFDTLYRGLEPALRQQFDSLRHRCGVLGELAMASAGADGIGSVAEAQLGNVNRLLWVYLKLLHSSMTLERFLDSVDPKEIDALERDARQKLEALAQAPADALAQSKRKSLEDLLATATARRQNLERANHNRELVALEIQRIRAKLEALTELAVNRHDPGQLTTGVDEVARSVEATEQTLGELGAITGLEEGMGTPPDILRLAERTRG